MAWPERGGHWGGPGEPGSQGQPPLEKNGYGSNITMMAPQLGPWSP